MCVIYYCCWVLLSLDWVIPMMLLNSHVTCLCIFHAYVLFLSTLNMFFLLFSLFLSLSLCDRLRYGTQITQIHSSLKPSSWFQVILFYSISSSGPWWEGQEGLLWDFPGPWHSSEMPSHSVEFLWHYATWCHLDSGMGISMWETRALSCRVYTTILLQHTWHRYPCASIRYAIQRYTYSSSPDFVAEVLRVPRVSHANYPSCDRLWTVSWDMLISHFYETPSI